MTKIYIYRLLPDLPYVPVLYPQFGKGEWFEKHLYAEGVYKHYTEPFFEIVNTPADADFILVPHIYKYLSRPYLKDAEAFAAKEGKRLIVSAFGDDDAVDVAEATVVLRYSQYRYQKRKNDIMVPTYSPGASLDIPFSAREKKNQIPTVGFCGWAEYENAYDAFKASIKNIFYSFAAIVFGIPILRARKKGIYFRKKAIATLRRSAFVKTDFIIRTSFSSHKETISVDAEQARKEFIQNILENDLSLTIKGDGNAATRFYEIIALGRIPVVIDTDTVLPFEDIIDYASFSLIISFEKIGEVDKHISKFYDRMTPEEYIKKQRLAREAFDTYLRADKFYRHLFSNPREITKRIAP